MTTVQKKQLTVRPVYFRKRLFVRKYFIVFFIDSNPDLAQVPQILL